MADFAVVFKNLRKERGLTQQELADRLGTTKSTISMYERGERRPGLDIAEAITDFFGVDLSYLIGTTDKVTKLTGTHEDEVAAAEGGAMVLLSAEERALIKAYRLASADTRSAARAVLGVD